MSHLISDHEWEEYQALKAAEVAYRAVKAAELAALATPFEEEAPEPPKRRSRA